MSTSGSGIRRRGAVTLNSEQASDVTVSESTGTTTSSSTSTPSRTTSSSGTSTSGTSTSGTSTGETSTSGTSTSETSTSGTSTSGTSTSGTSTDGTSTSGTSTSGTSTSGTSTDETSTSGISTVVSDTVDRGTSSLSNKYTSSTTGELTSSDQEIVAAMAKRGVSNLVNPATAQKTYATLTNSTNAALYSKATEAARAAVINGSSSNISRAADYINQLATNTGANAMEILFFVFRESIQATNEDKKYFLNRLQDYNTMADELSEYLSDLVSVSQDLSSDAAGAKYPDKTTISVEIQKFDTTTLNKDGEVATMEGYPQTKTLDRSGLNDTIKDVETAQETVRNKRQMASTAFENFDQKANQLYNLMASVLKTTNEMRSSTTRNML